MPRRALLAEVIAELETFVDADGYWHGYDERRSVSLSSFVVSEERDPVRASRILRQAPPLDGSPVDQVPPGLLGRAVTCAASEPARASQLLSGLLATDGHLLLVTVTSDDLEWARRVWLSIRSHAVPFQSPRGGGGEPWAETLADDQAPAGCGSSQPAFAGRLTCWARRTAGRS